MKKFSFGLEKILTIKQKELDMISQDYARVLNQKQVKEQRLAYLNDQLNQLYHQRQTMLRRSTSSQQLHQMRFKEDQAQYCIKEVTKAIETLHLQCEQLLKQRQAKKIEVSGLEKLKEKQLAEFNQLSAKQEEAFIESLWNQKNNFKQ
ncbi:MAG: hypothetical protein KGZ38_04520 [Erysipelothrix sp.]|nr:hypothetical protein [Erysipelothrix sp.]